MDPKRKNIIIHEIHYWKKSKLLPEHYCDFLLSLYTEGEVEEGNKSSTKSLVQRSKAIFLFIAVQLLLVMSVLVIYFTDFSFIMQMILGFIFSVLVFYIATKTLQSMRKLAVFYMLTGALILFLLTVHGVVTYTNNNQNALAMAVMIHCGIWIIVGLKWRMSYFSIGGGLGILVLAWFWWN
ncbi:hypothetical protein [Halalkalibacter urbisdiaboli]|uniref:hypothetical protein n=1 Tax=Halalkalibacter urbisdiaboli TaxID=1960589 RepID=UPI000B440879|nr:hypothetical protein [Halalkalibacter urbisdiaboli]